MSRKIIRNGMRRAAERGGFRPSKAIREMFNQFQIDKLGGGEKGVKGRSINQAKGTHPKRTWRMRIQAAIG